MKKIVIFAGTTEGRRLSEILANAGIAHTVCVATEYGEIVMQEQTEGTEAVQTGGQPLVNLHRGRMDREQMQKFLRDEGYEIVVDATHPYARVVTENLRGAVDALKSLEKDAHFPIYLRLERKIDGTTGSKELAVYCASGRLNDRLYVRILPGRESLELCMEQGIKGRQIPALQGPFFHRDERCHPKAVRHPPYGHEKQRPHRRVSGKAGSSENTGNSGVCHRTCEKDFGCHWEYSGDRLVFVCRNLWKTGTTL